jgi:EAL domain-containing protein (putative c-di-GMP-specific phosphodiesterase class I)
MLNMEYYRETLELENTLWMAHIKKEFRLHYQPNIDLVTGKIIGAEALIRWEHPERGLVPPAEFIPITEQSGLILPIGEWVLRTACLQNKAWQEAGLPPMIMSVNLSARQLYQPQLVDKIKQILKETKLDPAYLELEITEGILLDVQRVLPIIRKLKRLGVSISLDDFGTGYSSLYYLKEFPIDKLKIDQSFVRTCINDFKDATIVKTIIKMAHELDMKVVAEGVEGKEQLIFLQQNLCDICQGYLVSKPLPPDEFEEMFVKVEKLFEQEGIPEELNRQQQLEAALEAARQEWQATMRQQQGMIFKFIKLNGQFIHTLCDGALLYKINLSPGQVIGRTLHDFLPGHVADAGLHYYEMAWNGEDPVQCEFEANGVRYFTSLRSIKQEGKTVEVIGSSMEIAESFQQ